MGVPTPHPDENINQKVCKSSRLAIVLGMEFEALPQYGVVRKKVLLSDTAAQEIEPDVCAFCLKEDPPCTEKGSIDWVHCGN